MDAHRTCIWNIYQIKKSKHLVVKLVYYIYKYIYLIVHINWTKRRTSRRITVNYEFLQQHPCTVNVFAAVVSECVCLLYLSHYQSQTNRVNNGSTTLYTYRVIRQFYRISKEICYTLLCCWLKTLQCVTHGHYVHKWPTYAPTSPGQPVCHNSSTVQLLIRCSTSVYVIADVAFRTSYNTNTTDSHL